MPNLFLSSTRAQILSHHSASAAPRRKHCLTKHIDSVFRLLGEDLWDLAFLSGTASSGVKPYPDSSLYSLASPPFLCFPTPSQREITEVCMWSTKHLLCLAFKFNNMACTGYTTITLHSRKAAVLSADICISPKNDSSISLYSKFHKISPFSAPVVYSRTVCFVILLYFVEIEYAI